MKLTKSFFNDIRGLISNARATVARGVDLVQVHTNFEIGWRIIEQEQKGKDRAAYGQEVIKQLAERLEQEFGRGYSKSNLEYMRCFYLENEGRLPIAQSATGQPKILQSVTAKSHSSQIRQSVTAELPSARPFTLGWTHYVFLLGVKKHICLSANETGPQPSQICRPDALR